MDVGYRVKPGVDIGQIQGTFIHVECFNYNPMMCHNSNLHI